MSFEHVSFFELPRRPDHLAYGSDCLRWQVVLSLVSLVVILPSLWSGGDDDS
jgi:hypothetical protein